MNGTIREENLEELEKVFKEYQDFFPTQPTPVRVYSSDMLENAGKLIQCLHPDGAPDYHAVMAEPADFNAEEHGPFPAGHKTICVTGNGPRSEENAALIAGLLWFMPEILRTLRYSIERDAAYGSGNQTVSEILSPHVLRPPDSDLDAARQAAKMLDDLGQSLESESKERQRLSSEVSRLKMGFEAGSPIARHVAEQEAAQNAA